MRVVAAPDSFKGALDARSAAAAIGEGATRGAPGVDVVFSPMADGGEGTLEIIIDASDGRRRRVEATGTLGEPRQVPIGLIREASTAVIELAQVAGHGLVPPGKRDPLATTTFGLGQVIRAVVETGIEEIILAIGGSATVDGGAGMMQALGLTLLDRAGRPMASGVGGGRLSDIANLAWDRPPEGLEHVGFTIACDVLNPSCGPNGAAVVYGPQKGADPAAVKRLERGLLHWAGLLEASCGRPLRDEPGTGAAGGAALPLVGLLGATLVPGVDFVSEMVGLPNAIGGADLVFTGEGRLDRQSMMGKVVGAVGRMCRTAGTPCVALVGAAGDGAEACFEAIDRFHVLDCPLQETGAGLAVMAERVALEMLGDGGDPG